QRVPKIVINIVKDDAAKSTVFSPLMGSSSLRPSNPSSMQQQPAGCSAKDCKLGIPLDPVLSTTTASEDKQKQNEISLRTAETFSAQGSSSPPHIKEENEYEEPPVVEAQVRTLGVDAAFANLQNAFDEQVTALKAQLKKDMELMKFEKSELAAALEQKENEVASERAAKISLQEAADRERIERAEVQRRHNAEMEKMRGEAVHLKKTIESLQHALDAEGKERLQEKNGYLDLIKRKDEE
ncbi:hypothetical protein PMAYCL1PPCAC_09756, partial [Pristionchus mayeri]